MTQSSKTIRHNESARQVGKAWWRWLLVLVYAVSIFILSALPGDRFPAFHVSDKFLHAAEFGVLSFLLCRALHAQKPTRAKWMTMGLSILVAIGYGVTDEAHQLLVSKRVGDLADLLADSLGAVGAAWVWNKAGTRWPWIQ